MKKIVSLILLTTMIICSLQLFSCGDKTNNPANSDTTTTASDNTEEENIPVSEIEQIYGNLIHENNFNGQEIRFVIDDATDEYRNKDIYAEEQTGDSLNDAVYIRNRSVEARYNVNITAIRKANPYGDSKKSITAGEDFAEVIVDGLINIAPAITERTLIPFDDVPNIDITHKWWDQEMNKGFSIANKHYFLAGDLLVGDNEGTFIMMFNKKLIESYALETPYDLVKNGSWTLDKMYEMSRVVTKDLGGDGVIDETDQWGLLTEYYHTITFISTSGAKMATKNTEDIPELTINSPLTTAAFEKAYTILTDKNATILSEDYASKYPTDYWYVAGDDIFNQGRSLFYLKQLANVPSFRNMEQEFGLLPIPKYSAEQDNYYSSVTSWLFSAIVIPATNNNLEMTGTILEAMSYESIDTLTKAYYDICLKGKYTRDNESGEMLDIVLNNRSFDLGTLYDWGSCINFYCDFVRNKNTDIASAYEKKGTTFQRAMDRTINSILG